LHPGDEVVAAADLYGGTYRLLERVCRPQGIITHYTDQLSPASFESLVSPRTRLVWIESPTNPLLHILDIAGIAEVAHRGRAILAVDNTFASPYLQQPLVLGADLVVHSTTKYIGGHSDLIGGAVVGARDRLEPIKFYQNAAGAVPGAFDAWLTLRGIKTLAVRMDRHCSGAAALAEWLSAQSQVERVYFPGLPGHPGHLLATRQMKGYGGMVSIRLRGGAPAVHRFLSCTRLFSLAESLGGVESLVCHPATMTHASIPAEIRVARGIDDGLLRLSVGIEDVSDLQRDLQRALSELPK
jgi:cystathionine beta-lyase/cystathionine gamma-synthase